MSKALFDPPAHRPSPAPSNGGGLGHLLSNREHLQRRQESQGREQAAGIQTAAAQQGIDVVTAQNALTQENLAPYLGAGSKTVGAQTDLLGLNGDPTQQAAIASLQDSPLYQSLFRTGQETVLANGAATGGLRGGNIQRGLADFGADTLTKVIQNQLTNLGGLAGQGQSAALGGGQLGSQPNQPIAQLFGDKGAATARGILDSSAAIWSKTPGPWTCSRPSPRPFCPFQAVRARGCGRYHGQHREDHLMPDPINYGALLPNIDLGAMSPKMSGRSGVWTLKSGAKNPCAFFAKLTLASDLGYRSVLVLSYSRAGLARPMYGAACANEDSANGGERSAPTRDGSAAMRGVASPRGDVRGPSN